MQVAPICIQAITYLDGQFAGGCKNQRLDVPFASILLSFGKYL